MQRYTIYLFLHNALHVSGGSSAHHQELKTVYTTSGTFVTSLLLPATVSSTKVAVTFCAEHSHVMHDILMSGQEVWGMH